MESFSLQDERTQNDEEDFSLRRKLKRLVDNVVNEIHVPNFEEQQDFFCKNWDREMQEELREEQKRKEREAKKRKERKTEQKVLKKNI